MEDETRHHMHLFLNSTFLNPFVDFINNNFREDKHLFYVYGDTKISSIKDSNNLILINEKSRDLIKVIISMNKMDKIYIHGLFSLYLILIIFLQPWLLKKCCWVIWGADLYYYNNRKKTFKSNIYEFVRRRVIKNMSGLITHIKGDYELAREWYGAKGEYYYSFMYPSNLYKEYQLDHSNIEKSKTYIQIGNSADPSNNHIEVLEKIHKFKDRKIEIICPLSYGDVNYKDKVILEGHKLFGDKFIPLTEFMPFEEYLETLAKIDIAIFNHNRQQAMGNITTLLGLGKKVYIRDDITTWQFCMEHDLVVYNSNLDFEDLFEEMDTEIKDRNRENVKRQFSEEKLVEDWKRILES